jgi:hypothetical protein
METATFFSVLSRHNDILLCSFAVTNENTKRPTQTTTTMMAPSIDGSLLTMEQHHLLWYFQIEMLFLIHS